MTDVPQDRKYTRDHEWVQRVGDRALVGLTDFAQRQLGDVVFVELPEVGKRLESGEPLGTSNRSRRSPRCTCRWPARSWT